MSTGIGFREYQVVPRITQQLISLREKGIVMKRCTPIVAVTLSLIAGTLVCFGFSGESNGGSNKFEINIDNRPTTVANSYSEIDGPATSDLAINDCYDDVQSMNRVRRLNSQLVPSEISPIFEVSSQNA